MKNPILAALALLLCFGCSSLQGSEGQVVQASLGALSASVDQLRAQGVELSDELEETAAIAAGASAALQNLPAGEEDLSTTEQVGGVLALLLAGLTGYHQYRNRTSVERVAKANATIAAAAKASPPPAS